MIGKSGAKIGRRGGFLLASLLVLSACGGGADTDLQETQDSPTVTTSPPDSPSPTEPASPTATGTASPSETDAVAAETYELEVASPCAAVDEAEVQQILGTPDFSAYQIDYGEPYPPEFEFPITASSFICWYAIGEGAGDSIVRVHLGPVDEERFNNIVASYEAEEACDVATGTSLGGEALAVSCDYPEDHPRLAAEAGHLAVLGEGEFQCVAALEDGDLGELTAQIDAFCLGIVERLAG